MTGRPQWPRISAGAYTLKAAETPEDFRQVHRLNYDTFVREIPQHPDPGTRRLVDRFHRKNLYILAKRGADLAGMIAVHDQPPFSVASKLDDPAALDRDGWRPMEVRLLAVSPGERHRAVVLALLWAAYRYAEASRHTHLLISGLRERAAMYESFGFRALGPARASGDAWFVPMVMDVDGLAAQARGVVASWERRLGLPMASPGAPRVSLLPGPVEIASGVRAAFAEPPVSHRSGGFLALYERTRTALVRLTGAPRVALIAGGGTTANDAVAAGLAALRSRGVVLINGEFGRRLAGQAARFGLDFETIEWPWGQPWDLERIGPALRGAGWVWGVHSESSTGVLNDLPGLIVLAGGHGVRVCADCVSSIGAAPLELSRTYLATGSSGKAIGSIAGVAMVFASQQACAEIGPGCLPASLDFVDAANAAGPCFTIASSLIAALDRALDRYAAEDRFAAYAELGALVRASLTGLGAPPLAPAASASPVITTFRPPFGYRPREFAMVCRALGFEVYGECPYLAPRGLVQIAAMGDVRPDDLARLFDRLGRWSRLAA